jgi:hypothetical protein
MVSDVASVELNGTSWAARVSSSGISTLIEVLSTWQHSGEFTV